MPRANALWRAVRNAHAFFVKSPSGKSMEPAIGDSERASDAKAKAWEEEGAPPDRQVLLLKGKPPDGGIEIAPGLKTPCVS